MKKEILNIKLKAVKGIIVLFALLFVIPACDDRLSEINTNPNAITEIPDDFLFASLVRSTFRDEIGRFQQDHGAQYAHQAISNPWVKTIDQYEKFYMQGDVPEGMFNTIYRNSIKYVNEIVALNSEEGNINEVRIAMTKILGVVNFAKLTDYFGDIPYFEAGMGKTEVYLPKYNEQEIIYADMVEQLKIQMEILKAGNPEDAYPGQDPMYDNDLDSWVRFANSFRLRLAMRARFVDAGKYNPIITECLGQPLIEENDQSATLQNWDSENGELYNPWYNLVLDYESGVILYNVSEMLVEWLKETTDPRLEVLVAPNPDGDFIGMPNGLTDQAIGGIVRSRISTPGMQMLAADQPLYIMTASEIWFLRAEAALFDVGGSGEAVDLYKTGIEKALEQWEVPQNEINNYLDNSEEASLKGNQENQFRQIATQMWVGFIPNHQEAWNNMRRTGYPFIKQRTADYLSKGATNGYLPKRLKYPYTVEKTLNGDNLQEAIDRMGEDKIDNPVWWDVKD